MRTENDLRAALRSREKLAPAAESFLIAVDRPPRRDRRLALVAVAAGLLGAVPLAVHWSAHPPVVYPGSGVSAAPTKAPLVQRPTFSFDLRAVSVDGYDVIPSTVGSDGESATVVRAGTTTEVASL